MNEFKVGDKVRHKVAPQFDMVVVDFAKHWENDPYKGLTEKNPEYPICKYYNNNTNQWEQKRFHLSELDTIGW